MLVQSLSQEDPLEEGMSVHSSILACRIPWAEELVRLQSMGSRRVQHNWSDSACMHILNISQSVQLLSCVWLWDPMDCSMPGLPVHYQFVEPTQTHVHWVGDDIQPSHPLSSPSPPAFNLSQGLFQWVRSSHQVAKVLEFQLQYQSFHWIFRTYFL